MKKNTKSEIKFIILMIFMNLAERNMDWTK